MFLPVTGMFIGSGWVASMSKAPQEVFPGFGYIAASIPAVFFAGSILKSGFSIKNILKAALIGVLTIHFIGIIYMLFISAIKHEGWGFIKGWVLSQSLLKLAYDYVLSLIALFAAKYVNKYIKYLIS